MKPLLCIYHGNCFDGFTSAWCVGQALGPMVEFYEGRYGDPPPDVAGRDVAIVDFAYKRPVLDDMARRARSIVVLDHHKTAAEDLAGLPAPAESWERHIAWRAQDAFEHTGINLYALFDMERSGAGITWNYFHPGKPRPAFVNHVEDRDLWRFALPGTREIHAAMSAYPFSFAAWDEIAATPPEALRRGGEGILRKHDRDVEVLVEMTRRRMTIGGFDVPVANIAVMWVSDACNLMAQGERFAAAYYDGPGGRYFSLRSREGGFDVSAIARQYGGGGHQHAAGFKMPRGWEGEA